MYCHTSYLGLCCHIVRLLIMLVCMCIFFISCELSDSFINQRMHQDVPWSSSIAHDTHNFLPFLTCHMEYMDTIDWYTPRTLPTPPYPTTVVCSNNYVASPVKNPFLYPLPITIFMPSLRPPSPLPRFALQFTWEPPPPPSTSAFVLLCYQSNFPMLG